jgi:hypothetical protein
MQIDITFRSENDDCGYYQLHGRTLHIIGVNGMAFRTSMDILEFSDWKALAGLGNIDLIAHGERATWSEASRAA